MINIISLNFQEEKSPAANNTFLQHVSCPLQKSILTACSKKLACRLLLASFSSWIFFLGGWGMTSKALDKKYYFA
jgi:hypothetical protein